MISPYRSFTEDLTFRLSVARIFLYEDLLSLTENFLCRVQDYIILEYGTQGKFCIRYERSIFTSTS